MVLTSRFAEALAYSFALHASQRRKGSDVPYVSHLLGVAAIVLEHGASEDEAIAALLHDAVEDQGGAPLRQEICRSVWSDGGRNRRRLHRRGHDAQASVAWCKEAYVARLSGERSSVHLVCAADKLHNVRSLVHDYRALGESLWQRFNGGRDGTLWYYRAVVDALRAKQHHAALIDELDRAVSELERLAAAKPLKNGI